LPGHTRGRQPRLLRLLAPLFAALTLALGATACGDDEEEPSAPPAESAVEEPAGTATDEPAESEGAGAQENDGAKEQESGGAETEESEGVADGGSSDQQLTVTATEYDFELSATPTVDTQRVIFKNQGKEPHALVFGQLNEGFTLDEAVELEGEKGSAIILGQAQARPGETTTLEVRRAIEPGEYAMLCPIGGPEGLHYKLGQLEQFEIG